MSEYSLSHVRDQELLRNLKSSSSDETAATAYFLAHIAEFDKRRLYLPAGYPSMHSYCVHELGRPSQSAFKRIRAARTALRFPRIFAAVAEGRLWISGIVLLAPHLTPQNADELLDKAEGRSEREIEQMVAQYFPRPDLPELMRPLPPPPAEQLSARTVEDRPKTADVLKLNSREDHIPRRIEASASYPKVAPLSAQRFALQVTIDQDTQEKLRYAQALLGHRVSKRDIAQVLSRALDALIARLEKQKFGATSRPRRSKPCSSDNPRYIPVAIRREVWERDGGQCTYVSENGTRCPECSGLEFDHVLEVARGGGGSACEGIRLRCRAHNQYSAERTFGLKFMARKRAQAKAQAAARQADREITEEALGAARAAAEEVIPALRELGFRADESRRAAAFCARTPSASLEARVKLALAYLCPKRSQPGAVAAAAGGL